MECVAFCGSVHDFRMVRSPQAVPEKSLEVHIDFQEAAAWHWLAMAWLQVWPSSHTQPTLQELFEELRVTDLCCPIP
jgi:hypothetical protein